MPDINDLGLTEESTPVGDWNAPESGAFAPEVWPGTYRLVFELPEDPANHLGSFEVEGVAYMVVNFNPIALANGDGTPVVPREDGKPRKLMFQRASSYKHPSFKGNSDLQELLRSLGLVVIPYTPASIYKALQGISGRGEYTAEIGWRAYFEAGDTNVSTHPRKR